MQNSMSVPPKDQGELVMPSGTNQNGKVLQNKSQFRTIAPKIVAKVLTSRVLSCPSPSLSDRMNPGPCASATPLEVPAQNYALMQVAGQKGTFSFVALPHVASAQPIQKPRLPLPENLKLPIPRVQPPRKNQGARKKPVLSSSESGCSKPLAQSQTSPPPPDHPEVPAQPSPSKPVPSLDQAPASATMAAPTSEGGHGDSQPPVTNGHGDPNLPDTPMSSTPEEPSAKQGVLKISGKDNFASKETANKPATAVGEHRKGPVDLAEGPGRFTPALLGGALQLIPAVPKGKLPILPHARTRATKASRGESGGNAAALASPGLRADGDEPGPVTGGVDASARTARAGAGPQVPEHSPWDSAFCPAAELDPNHKAKRNGGSTKRKGRKFKVPDEILAFQGKRRKCKRIKTDSQESKDQTPGVVKKYRSIMPKPVIVVPALAPLASPAAVFPAQRPGGLGQGVVLNNSLSPKYLGGRQDAPKPSSASRNGFPGLRKPWHRCPICGHHFQFKQHLREHMNTHTNRRPYSCRICRKAYVRSGSLSTHMKLHHSENRLKKLVCCELCAKVFGHVRVYFGHLKEVHRVVISTEPSHDELQPGDVAKDRDRDVNVRGVEGPVHRDNKASPEEDLLLNHADEAKFQIKCGRCQVTAQSFAEIEGHVLYVHGEEMQGRLQEGIAPGSQAAGGKPGTQACPCWKASERRRLLRHCPSGEAALASPKPKRQLCLPHQDATEILTKSQGAQRGPSEPGPNRSEAASQGPACPSPRSLLPGSPSGFNCLLCTQTLGRKEELLLHWEQQHNCEDPPELWRMLSALCHQGGIELPGEAKR